MPRSAIGIATLGMIVAHTERRKRKITSTTRETDSSSVVCTSCTESRTASELSRRMSSFTDSGSCLAKIGSSSRTRPTTSTVFTPGCFCTASTMARAGSSLSPSRAANQLATRESCTPSMTSASSPRRTGAPLRYATTMPVNPAAFASWPLARICTDCRYPSSRPVGWLTLWAASAARTSSSVMPRLASSRGSSRTRSAYFCAPNTCTCEMPSTLEMRCAIIVSAYSSTIDSGSVGELSAR